MKFACTRESLSSVFDNVRGITFIILAVAALDLLSIEAAAQQAVWDKMPRMQLERQYAGPLKDTVIQRWRDPADGTVCYTYSPINAPHSPPTTAGYVQYGGNTIGSISCVAANSLPAEKSNK